MTGAVESFGSRVDGRKHLEEGGESNVLSSGQVLKEKHEQN